MDCTLKINYHPYIFEFSSPFFPTVGYNKNLHSATTTQIPSRSGKITLENPVLIINDSPKPANHTIEIRFP